MVGQILYIVFPSIFPGPQQAPHRDTAILLAVFPMLYFCPCDCFVMPVCASWSLHPSSLFFFLFHLCLLVLLSGICSGLYLLIMLLSFGVYFCCCFYYAEALFSFTNVAFYKKKNTLFLLHRCHFLPYLLKDNDDCFIPGYLCLLRIAFFCYFDLFSHTKGFLLISGNPHSLQIKQGELGKPHDGLSVRWRLVHRGL